MKREITNAIRFVLDELVPPIVRDSRLFMWPFYWLAYGGIPPRKVMDFKRDVYSFTPAQYEEFYARLSTSMSRRRATDLNRPCLEWILASIPDRPLELLDVGCGNGFLLRAIASEHPALRLHGCDVTQAPLAGVQFEYSKALLPALPYEDGRFDIVCCTHVLEHIVDLHAATQELLRVARETLLIVVPKQRYYYFTLDEHVNFFPRIEPLLYHFRDHDVEARELRGDWAVLVRKRG